MLVWNDKRSGSINLKQLIFFRKAVETGNLTRAASELNVAQTALGLQIRNLEEELGVTLLERHSRGVRATSVGRVLLTHADDILARLEKARHAVQVHAQPDKRVIRLGLTPSIVRLVGDAILTELSEGLSSVQLRIAEDFSFILMRQMAAGEIDCALTYMDETDPSYLRRALLEEDLLFLTAPGPDAGEGPITFRDVTARDLVLTAKQDVVTRALMRIADRLGVGLSVTYEVQSIRAVKNLVAKGVADTIIPFGAAESEISKGEFVARPVISPAVIRTLAFVRPDSPAFSGIEAEFDAFIDAVADKLHDDVRSVTRRL
jgi:LysR family transcriptional regulator, nitrogen assimilation regulatory protein